MLGSRGASSVTSSMDFGILTAARPASTEGVGRRWASTAGPEDVVINVGVTNIGHGHKGEMSAELIKRFSLRPRTARALRDMLREVIANIDADRQRRT